MSQPSFIQRSRQRAQQAQEARVEAAAAAPAPSSRNPFVAAADDLAGQWETMRVERDNAREEAEHNKGENIYLSGKVDELTRELKTRTDFFELEIERLRRRADDAVEDAVSIRAKMALIGDALRLVLDQDRVAVTVREPPQQQTSSMRAAPRNLPSNTDLDEKDERDLKSLVHRLNPPSIHN